MPAVDVLYTPQEDDTGRSLSGFIRQLLLPCRVSVGVAMMLVLTPAAARGQTAGGVSVEAAVVVDSAAGVQVAITSGGVRLSLQLAARAYPRNALVPVTVQLKNHTRRALTMGTCLADSLVPEVVGNDGSVQYPPVLPPPGAPFSPCPGPYFHPPVSRIAPGGVVVRHVYVMLRSLRLRATAQLRLNARQAKPTILTTPLLRVRPVSLAGPRLRLYASTPLHAAVSPVAGAGSLLYPEFSSCLNRAGVEDQLSAVYSTWLAGKSRVFRPFRAPGCGAVREWHLFVAQVGRPVARVDYCPRRDSCVYPFALGTP